MCMFSTIFLQPTLVLYAQKEISSFLAVRG
jgi:hypothetical protein